MDARFKKRARARTSEIPRTFTVSVPDPVCENQGAEMTAASVPEERGEEMIA